MHGKRSEGENPDLDGVLGDLEIHALCLDFGLGDVRSDLGCSSKREVQGAEGGVNGRKCAPVGAPVCVGIHLVTSP